MFSQEPLYVLTKLHNVFGHMGCTFSCGLSLTLFNLQTTENTYTLYCACGCGESQLSAVLTKWKCVCVCVVENMCVCVDWRGTVKGAWGGCDIGSCCIFLLGVTIA